jgi:signal transduction histidine kinase
VGEDGGIATLAVLDRGGGVAPGLESRVFEPGVTSKPQGYGLGLTIARALARQHGGEVRLQGRPGGGCAALLTLPVDTGAALAAGAGGLTAGPSADAGGARRAAR